MTYIERSYEEFEEAVKEWLDDRSTKDEVTLVIGREEYSPRRILEEIQGKTEFGQKLFSHLQEAAQTLDIDPIKSILRYKIITSQL